MVRKKILIVDDDKDLLRLLGKILKENGYDTIFAYDSYSATSLAKKEKLDLIILDLGLPGGGGFSVLERLEFISNVPIIVLTGAEPNEVKERALKAGAAAFLQKPVDKDIILLSIQELLKESEGSKE